MATEKNTAAPKDEKVDLFVPKGYANDEPNQLIDVNGVKMATVESDNPEDIPEFKDLYFKNITCFNAGQKLVIKPMPLSDGTESIHDIHFENCPTITE